MMRGRWLLMLALFTSCTPEGVGDVCELRSDCLEELECVIVNDGDTVCLPTPRRRTPQACTNRTDCTDSSDTVWPVDVACIEEQCRCPTAIDSCTGIDEVFEEETCSCVQVGSVGSPCLSPHTCSLGLACDKATSQCTPGEGAGTTCQLDSDCSGSDCVRRNPAAPLGVCESE